MVQLSVCGIVSVRMSSMFTSSQKIWMYSTINISIKLSQEICNIPRHVMQLSVSVCTSTVVGRREVRVELYLKMGHITTYNIYILPSWMVSYVFILPFPLFRRSYLCFPSCFEKSEVMKGGEDQVCLSALWIRRGRIIQIRKSLHFRKNSRLNDAYSWRDSWRV